MNVKSAAVVLMALLVHNLFAFSIRDMFPEIVDEMTGLVNQSRLNAKLAAEPVLGEWSIGFSKCKAYAEANGVPMFMIWSSVSCSHCNAFDQLFVTEAFKTWSEANKVGKVVLCFSDDELSGEGVDSASYNWSGGTGGGWAEGQFPWQGYLINYPFVAFYWPANRIDYHLSGGDLAPEWYSDEERLSLIYAAFEKWFAGYEPGGDFNKYGGVFAVGTDEGSRLEAQPGFTTAIEVPLMRTNSVEAVGTNWLAYVYNNVTGNFQVVSWAVGAERAYPSLTLPVGFRNGDTIGLVLTTEDRETVCDESSIACVTVGNSPANPHWIGEKRTVNDLPFGEWTMDYALATNKVAQHNRTVPGLLSAIPKRAYTLLLLEGSLWCPDCQSTDRNFLDYTDASTGKKPFVEWARSNNVALVACDIPNLRKDTTAGDHPYGDNSPALLKYDAFIGLGQTLRSGAGYLSRHMVSNEVAATTLAGCIRKAGELRRPDWAANPYRPLVPSIFLLNEDGSVAARLSDFGISGPAEYKACFLDRLNEMIANVGDPCEEDNSLWSTLPTNAVVSARGTVANALCATDLTDIWRIDGAGQFVKVTVKSEASAPATVSLYTVDRDENIISLATPGSGDLINGISVEAVCPTAGDTYLSIVGNGAVFSIYSATSTWRPYTLTTRNVLIPSETMARYELGTEETVTVRLTRNAVYYISGVSGAVDANAAVRTGFNLYQAQTGGDVEFAVTPGAEAVVYGIASATLQNFRDVELVVKNHPNARLEAEQGSTQWVDVPVSMTTNATAGGITLFVSAFGGNTTTQTVEWATVDGDQAFVRVAVPAALQAGDTITLELRTLSGELIETGSITGVAPVDNSSVNPYWFGEKTAETLNFGEWTMDLAAVTGKVARYKAANPGKTAHAIMVVQGSLWCPNCWKMESNLWDRVEVKQWALANNVVFGVVDIDPPPFDYSSYPTLLTYDTFKLGHAPGSDEEKYRSGAGYLSRHMATADLTDACRIRNRALVNTSTLEGGWCRPERMEKEWKTGLPMIILMRGDGSIAGRYDRFNIEGPDAYGEYLLYRLNELLLTAADPHEENNADWRTVGGAESLRAGESVPTATLSANDRVDTYRLIGTDMDLSVSVVGQESGNVELKLMTVDEDGTETEMAAAVGDLAQGVTISNQFAQVSNVFIVVTGLSATGETFSPLNESPSARTYTLTTTAVLAPGGSTAQYTAPAGVNSVTLSVKEGQVYYLDGIAANGYDEAVFEKGADNLYYCKRTAETTVTLTTQGGTIWYGQWESGSFGFTEEEGDDLNRLWIGRTIYEEMEGKSKKVPITVHRNGNTFGPSAIWVRLLASSTTVSDRYEWVDQKVEWASGVGGDKTVYFTLNNDDVYDPPPQTLIFSVEPDEASSAEIEEGHGMLVFSILDDDTIKVGRLAITDASPAFARNMTVVAEEGSTVTFVVTRENGTSGEVSARLSLKVPGAAAVLSGTMSWENRTRFAERMVTFTVPSYEVAKKAVVTLMPNDGIEADPKRKTVTVQIVPAAVPSFVAEDGRRDVLAWIGSAVSERVAVSNLVGYGEVTIAKLSGSLPPGVTATYDKAAQEFVISGAPKKVGDYTAVYQVSQSREGKVVSGRTVRINIDVSQIDASWFIGGEVNPALQTSRTYRNIMIVADDGSRRLRGLLTLSLPSSGRLSAKYTCSSGVYAYAAAGWDDIDLWTGDLTATLVCTRAGMADRTIAVTAAADGSVAVALQDIDDPTKTINADAVSTDWSESNAATAWSGEYNIMLGQMLQSGSSAPTASGHGYMALKMTDDEATSGQMTFAGCLPDGRTFSGASVLLYDSAFGTKARLPFLASLSDEELSGALTIERNAKVQHLTSSVNLFVAADDVAVPYWSGSTTTSQWLTRLSASGGYYDPDALCADCSRRFATGLYFLNGGEGFTSAYYGALSSIAPVQLAIADGTISIVQPAANANRLRLAFDLETGVFSGTLRLDFQSISRTGTFRGAIIPGWGGCDECGRLGPLGAGALWFTDFQDQGGTIPVRSGFAVEINSPNTP